MYAQVPACVILPFAMHIHLLLSPGTDEVRHTSSLPSLTCPVYPGVVEPHSPSPLRQTSIFSWLGERRLLLADPLLIQAGTTEKIRGRRSPESLPCGNSSRSDSLLSSSLPNPLSAAVLWCAAVYPISRPRRSSEREVREVTFSTPPPYLLPPAHSRTATHKLRAQREGHKGIPSKARGTYIVLNWLILEASRRAGDSRQAHQRNE